MRPLLLLLSLSVGIVACGPAEPFQPVETCRLTDEDGRQLFRRVLLEEERSCAAVESHAWQMREVLIDQGFTTRECFPELVKNVDVWIHADQYTSPTDVSEGTVGSSGEYTPASRTGDAAWIQLERWELAWSHEVLHHVDVDTLGIDPDAEMAHPKWSSDDLDERARYQTADERFYSIRWNDKLGAGF
jgi:hypothetical protein